MKTCAYFFDNYSSESIVIAAILWPVYFLPFYLFYKNTNNILLPLIASLILSSFTSLFFANSLVEYMIYFLGVGVLVFGSMAMVEPSKKFAANMIIGIISSLAASIILYLMRVKVYNTNKIPTTIGKIDTFKTYGPWLWIGIQILLYIYVLHYMIKTK